MHQAVVRQLWSGVRITWRVSWQWVRPKWPIWPIAAGLLIVGVDLWTAFAPPSWLLDTHDLKGADLAKARNDFRGTMLTALGGLALLVGALVGGLTLRETSRQNREMSRQNQEILGLQRRGQVTERFGKAIEQLGQSEEGKLDVRVGAIYALEQIAHDSPELHWPIMEVLTAHLRESRKARSEAPSVEEESSTEAEPDVGELPAEAQAIATVIGRRHAERDGAGHRLNLQGVDLPRVEWSEAHLERATLVGAYLDGAALYKAHLERAILDGAHLVGAGLGEAHLEGAILRDAHLEKTYLVGANLKGAALVGARLDEAFLTDAHLEGAALHKAHLEGAILNEAHLEGAILRDAHLDGAVLVGAYLDGAALDEAHLERAIIDGANLTGVDLTWVYGLTWSQLRAAKNFDLTRVPSEVREEAERELNAEAAGD